jgi:hypothetical protein
MRDEMKKSETIAPAMLRLLSATAFGVAILAVGAWLKTDSISVIGPAWAQAQVAEESPEDFPPGDGRDNTFYTCMACHGFKLVAAQGMSRAQWDETINLMTSKHGMPALEGKDREIVLNYLAATFPPRAVPSRGFQNPFVK